MFCPPALGVLPPTRKQGFGFPYREIEKQPQILRCAPDDGRIPGRCRMATKQAVADFGFALKQ